MKTKHIVIIVIIIIILLLLSQKSKENLDTTSTPTLSNEAIQSIANVYANTTGTVNVNNLNVTGTSNLVPKGTIVSWYGDITNIPKTWVLCDGTHNTPDLRGRFILGYNPGQQTDPSGGSIRKQRNMNATGGNEQLIANIGFYWWDGSWGNGIMYDAVKDVGFNALTDNTSKGMVMYQLGRYQDIPDIDKYNRNRVDPRPVSVTGKNTTESLPPYYVLAYIMKV